MPDRIDVCLTLFKHQAAEVQAAVYEINWGEHQWTRIAFPRSSRPLSSSVWRRGSRWRGGRDRRVGRSDFGLLQQSLGFMAFDLLYETRRDPRQLELSSRRHMLKDWSPIERAKRAGARNDLSRSISITTVLQV
jgi:bifunctional non-homologous end joining protein LigD